MSMLTALQRLGYKPYHLKSVMLNRSHASAWRAVAEHHMEAAEVIEMIHHDGFDATMDNPMCELVELQLRLFPEAKVILTTHPRGAKGWAKSFIQLMQVVRLQVANFSLTYPNILQFVPVLRDLTAMRCLMGQETMGLRPCELIYESIEKQQAMPGWLEEQYEKHNAYVRAKVPKETRLRLRRFALRISREKLLEFSVQDGWEPLCQFLGVPVPSMAFPHVNDSASMQRVGLVLQVIVYGWAPAVFLPADVNKGDTLLRLCNDHLGIRMDEVIAFGDNYNDMEMLTLAGEGVAMKNAKDELKEAANRVSEWSNDEDAVARPPGRTRLWSARTESRCRAMPTGPTRASWRSCEDAADDADTDAAPEAPKADGDGPAPAADGGSAAEPAVEGPAGSVTVPVEKIVVGKLSGSLCAMTQFVKWLKLPQGEEEESSEGMTFHPPTPQGSQQTARTALPLHHFIEVAKEVTAIPRAPALYIEATQGETRVVLLQDKGDRISVREVGSALGDLGAGREGEDRHTERPREASALLQRRADFAARAPVRLERVQETRRPVQHLVVLVGEKNTEVVLGLSKWYSDLPDDDKASFEGLWDSMRQQVKENLAEDATLVLMPMSDDEQARHEHRAVSFAATQVQRLKPDFAGLVFDTSEGEPSELRCTTGFVPEAAVLRVSLSLEDRE
ncbi:Putative phosphatase HI_0003 [Durusdinium trenchii]|uniref:Phosphatase HI_0003 n=1 Tax=Durusdinium trenchii TaxID=1381693 RepID=A0ABP0RY55_9DINO